ncbi:MAG: hypothetical protein ACP6IS_04160 [Candidatus Asgardarchaeia archaeon]
MSSCDALHVWSKLIDRVMYESPPTLSLFGVNLKIDKNKLSTDGKLILLKKKKIILKDRKRQFKLTIKLDSCSESILWGTLAAFLLT